MFSMSVAPHNVPHIVHVDLDAFYLGVERVLDPSLHGKPAVVGGGGEGDRGVVLSASYEARKAGVRSGMPLADARRRCPDLVSVRPRHRLYGRASRAVFKLMTEFTPVVQQVSVDEAYLDLTGTERASGPPLDVAAYMQREVKRRLRLDVTAAVSTARLVSKVATGLIKPRGLLRIAPGCEASFFAPLAAGRLPGVGKVTRRRLDEVGLFTMGDLQGACPDDLRRDLGRMGPSLRSRAHGIDRTPVRRLRGRRSIGHQRTLGHDVSDLTELEERLRALLEEGMWRMRGESLACRTVEVALRYPDMSVRSLHATLDHPTDIDVETWPVARRLLRRMHRRRAAVRRIGVRFSNLVSHHHQMSLVEPQRVRDRQHDLMRALDSIRARHGGEAIGYAAVRLPTHKAATS